MTMEEKKDNQEVTPTTVAATSVTSQKEQTFDNTRYDVERATINIDPAHLEYLRSLRPDTHPSSLFNTRFAQGLIVRPLYNYIVKYLDGLSVDVIRENVNKHKELITRLCGKELRFNGNEGKWDMHDLLRELFPKEDRFPSHRPEIDIDESDHMVVTGEKETGDDLKLTEIMRKHLANANVVDLGAGFLDFEKAAIMFGANRYTGIDLYGMSAYGQPSDRSNDETNVAFKALGLPCNTKCETVNIDILEGLYTKIPDNSSCFVICGVDECYPLSGGYVEKVNELIAQKTKIGGIVIVMASVLGHSLPSNFVEIYRDRFFGHDTFMGTRVYLRQ